LRKCSLPSVFCLLNSVFFVCCGPALSTVELAKDWLCFGFVFPWPENGKFLIFFLYQRAYVIFNIIKIGFVLQKIGPICRGFSAMDLAMPYGIIEKTMATGAMANLVIFAL